MAELDHFAILTLTKWHLPTAIILRTTTNNPSHLTCYWTDKKPRVHHLSRTVRGVIVPWYTYFCFVAWHAVEQDEAGDTLIHTFTITPWVECQTRWFTFRGEVNNIQSPSVGPIFKYHHPGLIETEVSIPITHDYDDIRGWISGIQSCPLVCPPIIEAGYFRSERLWMGSGLRFRNFPIPWQAVILEARLFIVSWMTNVRICHYTRIWAEQRDNPPDFSYETVASFRTRYENWGTKVNWDDIPPWTLNLTYTSPDITPVIQQIVNRPLWQSENALVLFWNDWDQRQAHNFVEGRRSYSHNVNPAKAVTLYVKYQS